MSTANVDVVVVGAGVVGLSAALVAAGQGLKVALVEAHMAKDWQASKPDLRVYAIARDSEDLLNRLGAWPEIASKRAFAYTRMTVFDAVQSQPLNFSASELGHAHLGHIVENGLIVAALWQKVNQHALIQQYCPERTAAIAPQTDSVQVELQSGRTLQARAVLGCDGAASKVRSLMGIETDNHDYGQSALVAFVETEKPHQNTAWQRFLHSGPVAFLPFGERVCSIVWSLPKAEAERLLQAEPDAFCRTLDSAFAGTLGKTRLHSERAAFALKRALAKSMLKERVLLLGDAAHAVHPLAGQGMNLGLRDVSAWHEALITAKAKTGDALNANHLQRWARARYSENAVAALAFENINRVFSNDHFILSLSRGHVLGLADKLGPLKNTLARYAMGM